MKAYVRKEAVIASTKSLGVKGWAEHYWRWIPCWLQDDATGLEPAVPIKLKGPLNVTFRLIIDASQIKVLPRHLSISIPLRCLQEWKAIRAASEAEA